MFKKLLLFGILAAFTAFSVMSCTTCDMGSTTETEEEPPDFVSVTFQVDMSAETIDPTGVHIAGDFGDDPNGDPYPAWDPGSDSMMLSDADEDMTYEITIQLAINYTYYFKYTNGNSWAGEEWAGDPNRTVDVLEEDLVLDPVVFGVQP